MSVAILERKIISSLKERGWDARIVSASRIGRIRDDIVSLHETVGFDEGFYACLNKWVNFELPSEAVWDDGSVIIVSMPQPVIEASFEMADGILAARVPPTYDYHEDEAVAAVIQELMAAHGYQLKKADLPKKLLAVHSGLAVYGRNNITYVNGSGSFHRLVAFCSDLPCTEDPWTDLGLAEQCKGCDICARSCPTGAIDPSRFLLRAELCLTYFNEDEGDIPGWVDPAWHNALMGCLSCQLACPMNRERIRDMVKVSFTKAETDKILNYDVSTELDAGTIEKLDMLGFRDDVRVISRNLGLLARKASRL